MTQSASPVLCLCPLHHKMYPSSVQPSAEDQPDWCQSSSSADSPTCAGLLCWARASSVIILQCWALSHTLCFSPQELASLGFHPFSEKAVLCFLQGCGCTSGYHLFPSLLLEMFCSAEMAFRKRQNYTSCLQHKIQIQTMSAMNKTSVSNTNRKKIQAKGFL